MTVCDLIVFAGRTADRNPRAMRGSVAMGTALAERLGTPFRQIGKYEPPLMAQWDEELAAARPTLRILGRALEESLLQGRVPVTTLGRCASSLATLPVVARYRPDALILWFDAHGDCNLPEQSTTGYLGGMVLTGASGRWDTGLGSSLDMTNVVLVGSRDLDPAERELISSGTIRWVAAGPNVPQSLDAAIGGRPLYIHLDCDVLDAGIVPTEYPVPGGLSLDYLRRIAARMADNPIIGLEIAEFESEWAGTGKPGDAHLVVDCLEPLLDRIKSGQSG